MNELNSYTETVFESIRHVDEFGNEYWDARELQKALEYGKWENFKKVIDKAIGTCVSSNNNVFRHFLEVRKPIRGGNGNIQNVVDYKLSRYACYLIVQNSDSRKKVVALGQTYFAIQTRKMELTELKYKGLSEDEKRLYTRKKVSEGNYSLNRTALNSGVKNLAEFHNAGYRGLYNGETANDIAKRKDLRYREDILDNMCSDELIANLFRISQTNQKLINDCIHTEYDANITHYNMGKDIRDFIKKQGGTMPEKLPTPVKSLKKKKKKKCN